MDDWDNAPRVRPKNETHDDVLPSSPPPLARRAPILLPPLLPSGTPAPCLHPILKLDARPLAGVWNVREPLAYLDMMRAEQPLWLDHPATYPPLDSMTVKMESGNALRGREGGGRCVVVFPEEEGEVCVTVRDVLGAVERFYSSGRGEEGSGYGWMRKRGRRQVRWVGLEMSERESEVWVVCVM